MAQHSHAPRRVARPEKQNTFFGGAAILAVGIMVVKLIGMFYKIPLINIIGEQGSADFGNAYNIYAVLLTISTAGLPVAVSKLVSEANATGRQNQVRRVFRLSLALFLTLGVLSFLIMSFGSAQLAALMNDDQAAPGIRALAPAVICVGCLSAFRGYAQGHGNMTPTAVSQIIEALCKLVVGLGLAYWLVKAGADQSHAAAGAIDRKSVVPQPGGPGQGHPRLQRHHHPQSADDRRAHYHQLLHGGYRHCHRLLSGPGPAPAGPAGKYRLLGPVQGLYGL